MVAIGKNVSIGQVVMQSEQQTDEKLLEELRALREQVKAQQQEIAALRETQSVEAYRSLVEHSLQGLTIYQEHRIVFANRMMNTITGYTAEELVALSEQDIIEHIHPSYRAQVIEYLQQVLTNELTTTRFEYCIQRKDGSVRWVESNVTRIEWYSKPALQVAFLDLTEWKQAEESLRESEERYRTLVEISPSAILLTDVDGIIRFCNQQATTLFGYASTEELCGRHGTDLIDFEAADSGSMAHMQRVIESGNLRNIEYTLCRKDGSRFPAEVNSSVIADSSGYPTALIIMVQDISERKRLQAQLIQNERFAAGGRLAASVAHEINTPLQSLQNSLGLIRKIDDNEERNIFLSLAQSEIERVGRIVHQLLDLYRPATTTYEHMNINVLIERILLLLGKQLKDNGIETHKHLASRLPSLLARTDELTQLLLNLFINAIDAMPRGGKLEVVTCLAHSHSIPTSEQHQWPAVVEKALTDMRSWHEPLATPMIVIIISDTGHGITADLHTQIFEPFVTTKENGTGLGLAISRQIVEQQGGSIRVQSTPDEGSTFLITLPVPNEQG
jgi:PAS domain S-box-containing protein